MPLQGKGGRNPVQGLFPAGNRGTPLAELAKREKWVEEVKERRPVTTTSRTGRVTTSVREVSLGWRLTQAGQDYLVAADNPKPLLEALLAAVKRLEKPASPPATDPTVFTAAVAKASRECVVAIDNAFADLQKKLQAAFAEMQQAVVAAIPKPTAGPDVAPVLGVIGATLKRLESAAPSNTPQIRDRPTTQPPAPAKSPPAPPLNKTRASESPLREAMKRAYDHLCLFVEFRDKLVELPRLYHETQKLIPTLTVEQFHRELESLQDEWKVELHVLNEVATAKERELAIWKDDRLYYYAFWK